MLPIRVDRDEPIALHDQVAAEIRKAIEEGEAASGERLPLAQDSASVASLQTATGGANHGPIGTFDPPLKQIPIVVNVWIDPQHRVRQMSTWEPYYTQNNTNGSSQGGPYIVQLPTPTPAAPPRQQAFVQTTLDLRQFGTPAHVTPPPAAKVATPR
jgi:hypothetical protein